MVLFLSIQLFLQVRKMATSFKHIKTFLSYHSTVDSLQTNEESVMSAVDCAQRGLDGLWFTTNKEFVQKAMELCFSMCVHCTVDKSIIL